MVDLMNQLERDQLTAALHSGQPERVGSALATLDSAWRQRCFGPLPMPEPNCLDAFGEFVPANILSQYLTVLQNYPDFEPTPSGSELRHALVEAVIQYGRGENTLDVALALQIDDFPELAVSDALKYIQHRGLVGFHEMLAAQRLVDYLLDSDKTRQATVNTLRVWAMTDQFRDLIDAVLPRLDDAERSSIEVGDED